MSLPPITLEELQLRVKRHFGFMPAGVICQYNILPLHDFFKLVGYMAKENNYSTFIIDLTPNIPRQFLDCELNPLLVIVKANFDRFTRTSRVYNTPF